MKIFLEAGAQLTHSNWYGRHALHIAARLGDFEGVSLLINAGANVNKQDIDGDTALDWAFYGILSGGKVASKGIKAIRSMVKVIELLKNKA